MESKAIVLSREPLLEASKAFSAPKLMEVPDTVPTIAVPWLELVQTIATLFTFES